MSIPGLPPLPSSVSLLTDVALLISDAISFLTGFGGVQWGIFQNGVSVVQADSVISMGYKQDWSISNYPVEEGGFQSYNKVDTPFDARVRFASGGSQANRQALLDSITAIAGTLDLFDVVTPEAVYSSVNIQGFSYRRSAQDGVGLIQVDIQLIEVRVTATGDFTSTQSPSAAPQANGGTVQPTSVTSGVMSQVTIRPITE